MIKRHLYMIIWSFILVALVVLMTAFGFKYKKIIPYKKAESKMVEVCKKLSFKSSMNKKDYSLKELKSNNKELKKSLILKKCTGKVTIKKTFFNKEKYIPTLNCPKYKTSVFL